MLFSDWFMNYFFTYCLPHVGQMHFGFGAGGAMTPCAMKYFFIALRFALPMKLNRLFLKLETSGRLTVTPVASLIACANITLLTFVIPLPFPVLYPLSVGKINARL
jgi:hypothetical protein